MKRNPPFTGSGWTEEKAWIHAAKASTPIHVSAVRAKEIMAQARARGFGPWSDSLTKVMKKGEYNYIYDVWGTLPGHYSFAGTLMAIANGHVKLPVRNPTKRKPIKHNPASPGAVTLYFTGAMGAIKATEGKLVGVDEHGIDFIPKGGRREARIMTYYSPFIMAVRGWGHPKPGSGMVPIGSSTPGVSVSRGLYRGHDPRWTSDFMRDVGGKLKPVVLFQDGKLVHGAKTNPRKRTAKPACKNPSVTRQHQIPDAAIFALAHSMKAKTARNDHMDAHLDLAKLLASPLFIEQARRFKDRRDKRGYVDHDDRTAEYALYKRMMAQLKRRASPRGYELIHRSL